MSTYRPNIKTWPFVLLALVGILFIYDAGVEQETAAPEIISETLLLPNQNTPSMQNKKIHVWTVDSQDQMQSLINLGVDGIMTDRPSLLKDTLIKNNLWI